jgi:hypothetical protein
VAILVGISRHTAFLVYDLFQASAIFAKHSEQGQTTVENLGHVAEIFIIEANLF